MQRHDQATQATKYRRMSNGTVAVGCVYYGKVDRETSERAR